MKTVLVITYYWPPAGGPGVQRILKFIKYFPQLGWKPVVLTVKNGEYQAIDNTLQLDIPPEVEVFKTFSLEPGTLYKKFTGFPKKEAIPTAVLAEKNTNWRKNLAHWIRLNLFVPDAKIGWVPFAIRCGKKLIETQNPDIIFSSSPPPSVHLIAKTLSKWSNIKWVADFRDPWTDIHYYDNQNRNKFVNKIDLHLEKSVLNTADRISCSSQLDIEEDFSKKVAYEKCINIANGYDEDDFSNLPVPKTQNDAFTLLHLGAVGPERIPHNIFKAIKKLADENKISPATFSLKFLGSTDRFILESIKAEGIESYVEFQSYLPHKNALLQAMQASALLLLVTKSQNNKRILPGKTFEYIRTGKPILALGPTDGEVARILNEADAGNVVSYIDKNEIYQMLLSYITDYQQGVKPDDVDFKKITVYNRKNLTQRLVDVFNEYA